VNLANGKVVRTMPIPDLSTARWRTSTRSSGQGGACVELADTGAVRDSKNATGPALLVDLTALLNAVKAGRFDL
jgi:hypothetical protein